MARLYFWRQGGNLVFAGARTFLSKWDPVKKPRAVWIRVYLLPKKVYLIQLFLIYHGF